jgi:hypothetical protein
VIKLKFYTNDSVLLSVMFCKHVNRTDAFEQKYHREWRLSFFYLMNPILIILFAKPHPCVGEHVTFISADVFFNN